MAAIKAEHLSSCQFFALSDVITAKKIYNILFDAYRNQSKFQKYTISSSLSIYDHS